ncbi:MAG: NADH-quinone oxidoreductase subunit NuoH [Gemmataceae bacterium]
MNDPNYYPFHFWTTIIFIGAALGAILGTCAYLILLERKIAAWTQDRLGPNRVGPWGLFQPLADGAKFLLKEDIIPDYVDKLFYMVAPAIAMSTALVAFAVVPFGPTDSPPERVWPQTTADVALENEAHPDFAGRKEAYDESVQFVIAPHLDLGIVLVFAISSLAAYAIILGGWSSNNKYSLMGALRSSAQLISYEIPLGTSVLGVALMANSLNLERIIDYQINKGGWNIVTQPLAALMFLISIFAECNRLPFDLPEAEQELVGGYHTEYSALKFALFFLAEYAHMITTSFLFVILFFGGWHLGWIAVPGPGGWVVKIVVFAVKMALLLVFYMLIRWTIPRFRFDQLMGLAWKVLIPLSLINLVGVMVVKHLGASPWWLLVISVVLLVGSGIVTLRRQPRPGPVVTGSRRLESAESLAR